MKSQTSHSIAGCREDGTSHFAWCSSTSTLSATDHVNCILSQANQRLYLFSRLKSLGLSSDALGILDSASKVQKFTYVLISFFGHLSVDGIYRFNALFKKSKKWGVITELFDLCDQAENQKSKLFPKSLT
jgi:hypothetical protein